MKRELEPMEGLEMVAAGLVLFYGQDTETMIAQQVERMRQSGDKPGDARRFDRWRRIAAAVRGLRAREELPSAV